MRILVCHPTPSFSVADVYVGWVEALRELGQHVIAWPFGDALTFYDAALLEVSAGMMRKAWTADQAKDHAVDRLCGALYKTRPDVLIVVSGFFVPPELLDLARWYGTKVVLLHTESPYEHDRQVRLSQHADITLVNDPTGIGDYQQPAIYVPHAYRPSVHKPGPSTPELECDLVFVGTGYASRIAFLEQMNLDGLDVVLAGNWQQLADTSPLLPYVAHAPDECLDNERAVDLYRSAKVGLNLYRREAERPELATGWAMGPRELEMAATGLFYLRDPRGEGDNLLPWLPRFTSPGEASELLRWWLERPDEREVLARKSMEAVADRTFAANAAALMRLLEQKG